jgi:hypothetical protein
MPDHRADHRHDITPVDRLANEQKANLGSSQITNVPRSLSLENGR